MNFRIGLIFLVFFAVSCANISLVSKKEKSDGDLKIENPGVELFQVEFESENNKSDLPRIKTESTVDILDGKIYNEKTEINYEQRKYLNRKSKFALILGPGLNRSVGYISVLKNFEKNNIKIPIISGTEFGAIISAMYASGMTPEMIEWNFYKYFREKSNAKIYSQKWYDEVDEFFLKRFQSVRVENLKKVFYLPLYSKKEKKIVYFNKGNLRNLILLNLKNVNMSGKAEYSLASEFEVFNSRFAKNQGADLVIAIDAIGKKAQLNESNEYVYGFYNRIIGNIKMNQRLVDLYYPLPLEASSLDADDDAGLNLQNALDYSEKIVSDIKKNETKLNKEECIGDCI